MIRLPAISATLSAAVFAILGAASRYHYRSVETRWQLAAFVAGAGAAEFIWRMAGKRASWFRWIVGASAAAVAITATKFHLEPQALHDDRARAAHVVRNSARKVEGKL